MKPTDAPLGLLVLCFSATLLSEALVAQKPTTVDGAIKKIDVANRNAPSIVAPLSESVVLSQKAPAGVVAPKECNDAWLGTLEMNKKKVGFVAGKSKADAELPDLLYVDLNGDGKFSDSEKLALETTTQEARGQKMATSKMVDAEFALGGNKIPAMLRFSRAGDRDPGVSVIFPTYLEAAVTIGTEQRVIAIQDKDFDGKFDSNQDLWLLAKPGDKPASPYALSGLGEHRFEGGKLIGIKVEGDKKVQVTTADAKGPDPKDAAAHRHRVEHIWSERFDKEKEGFVKAQSVDTARPLAEKGIDWQYVTFDEGVALAKKSGKPLFVDVMAFWCVWCYRMDYYTYPDKAVAEMLNTKFVPVKLIQEQDAANDYKRLMDLLGAKGIPAMGIFDGEGKKLHTIGGWSKPEKFLTELEKGLAAGAGGK